jgi:hypothetical protein
MVVPSLAGGASSVAVVAHFFAPAFGDEANKIATAFRSVEYFAEDGR